MTEIFKVDGIDVHVDGAGAQTLVMLHGWPDSYRLWDSTVEGLQGDFRCVRFSLPGFDTNQAPRVTSLAQMTSLIAAVAEHVSPGRAITLLAHDWGCLFGYEFAAQHPDRVARRVSKVQRLRRTSAGSKTTRMPWSGSGLPPDSSTHARSSSRVRC